MTSGSIHFHQSCCIQLQRLLCIGYHSLVSSCIHNERANIMNPAGRLVYTILIGPGNAVAPANNDRNGQYS